MKNVTFVIFSFFLLLVMVVFQLFLTVVVIFAGFILTKLRKKTNEAGLSPFHLFGDKVHSRFLSYVLKKEVKAAEIRGGNMIVLFHPDHVRELLKNDIYVYDKQATAHPDSYNGKLSYNNILIANGDAWKHHRTVANPAFTSDYLATIIPIFVDQTKKLLTLLGERDEIDIKPVIQKFTLDVLGAGAFGRSLGIMSGETNSYTKAFMEMLASPLLTIEFLFPFSEKIPLKKFKRRIQLVDSVIEMAEHTMKTRREERKQNESGPKYLLDLLLDSDLSDLEVRNNIWIFYVAGHETTAAGLNWGFHYLAKHPEYQQTMYEEIMKYVGDRDPTYEDLKNLTFVDMFIKEVLRMYPPFPMFSSRVSNNSTQINDILVPPNTKITTNVYVIHHLPEFWPEPEKFDPYRFTPENSKERHPFSFLPFSLGRRHCIGMNFSVLEQKVLYTFVIRNYFIKYVRDSEMLEARFLSPLAVHVGLQKR